MENLREKYLSYSMDYTVAVDEVDFSERLKPSAVLQYFQDLATLHANVLGIGFQKMLKANLIWVLTRMTVNYNRYPKIGEKITVTTFPEKPHVADAIRDYYITDENGKTIISGSSKWVVIDFNNHMIRRCSNLFDFEDSKYIPYAPFENANRTLSDKDCDYECIMSDKVHICELDRNVHMNNARYGDIMLNSFSIDWLKKHSIQKFDINFLSELKYGDCYNVYKSTEKGLTTSLRAEKDDKIAFRAEIDWKAND